MRKINRLTIEKNITNTRWTSGVQSLTYFVFSALKGLHMCNWVDVLLNLCLKCVLNELLATLFLYAASTLMRSSKYLEKCHNYKQIPWVRWHIFIMTKGTLSIELMNLICNIKILNEMYVHPLHYFKAFRLLKYSMVIS